MPNEAQIRRRMEQWLQSVRQKVVNGYWEVILVGGFSYTIGLTQFNHPEVLVCGLRPQNAGIALNYVGLQIRDHGAVFKAGDTVVMEPFEGNFTFGFRALDPEVADQLAARRTMSMVGGLRSCNSYTPTKTTFYLGTKG